MLHPLNPYHSYLEQKKRQEKLNRKILHRQLFNIAKNKNFITIDRGHVLVVNHQEALNHFNHHPDLFISIPFNYDRLAHDKEELERVLSEAFRRINNPF